MENQVFNTVMIPVEEYEALRRTVEELTHCYNIECANHKSSREQLDAMTDERDHWREANRTTLAAGDILKEQLAEAKADANAGWEKYADMRKERNNLSMHEDSLLRENAELQRLQEDSFHRLAAAQADNARLREALELIKAGSTPAKFLAGLALKPQPDHAALDARLKEERERVADAWIAAHGFDKHGCAATIRALPTDSSASRCNVESSQ